MRFRTLRLPTGEFALIIDRVAGRPPSPEFAEAMTTFRKKIGAAGAFVSSEEVELEDADQSGVDSVRHEEEVVEQASLKPDGFKVFKEGGELIGSIDDDGVGFFRQLHFPRARLTESEVVDSLHDSRVVSLTFTADPAVIASATGISPAGLVQGGPREPISPEEWRGGEPGSDPAPEGVLADAGWDSSYVPQPGDRVRIVEIAPEYAADREGTFGTIATNDHAPDYGILVNLEPGQELASGTHTAPGWSTRASKVEPAPLPLEPEPYEPKEGDRVEIVAVNRHRGIDNIHHGKIGRVIGFEKKYGENQEDVVIVRRDNAPGAWSQGWAVYCLEVKPAPAEEPEQKPETD